MQDIDEFDPLDDILLSDEEFHDSKVNTKTSIFQKPKEIIIDEPSKEDKKKRMLAELFGTIDDPKESKKAEETTTVSKSDWLDLKTETKPDHPDNILNKSVTWQTPTDSVSTPEVFLENSSNVERTDKFDFKPPPEMNSSSDRRRSDSGALVDTKRSKQRFKSLDLDLEFDFDRPTEPEANKLTNITSEAIPKTEANLIRSESKPLLFTESGKKNTELEKKLDDTEFSYIPSSGINRRFGVSKTRNQTADKTKMSTFLIPDVSPKVVNSENTKESLPTWLEPKNLVQSSSDFSTTDISNKLNERITQSTIKMPNIIKSTTESNKDDKFISNIPNNPETVFSIVHQLKNKQEELKNIAKAQTDSLIQHEREIQNSAIKLMQQHRDNMSALIQIISSDGAKCETNQMQSGHDDISKKIQDLQNTVSQLQNTLVQQEFEKSELKLKLEHAEKKYSTDLTMLEDLYKYKLQISEERETYLKKEAQILEEEYISKIQRQKENENEIIHFYQEKIKIMQEEHLNEIKYIGDYNSKSFLKESRSTILSENITNEKFTSKELIAKEAALEEKRKELLELEERLNCQKITLEGKTAAFQAKIEEFEIKNIKERLSLEQLQKDLKLSESTLQQKQISWEKEKQRQTEYLSNYEQELEDLKENLLKEQKQLMKEKFHLSSEKARLEAIMNLDGTSNQFDDLVQNKAELRGTLEEVNRLKSKLQSEREQIKQEERRLKEEGWKLKDIEQQLLQQNKYFQKLLNESEMKRDEGIQALKKAQRIETQINDRMEEIEKRLSDLKRKEEQLTKEKIEISKDRDLLNKRRYQLDMILPQLTYEEQLPFNIMNKNIIDPRIMIMKLKAENETLFE